MELFFSLLPKLSFYQKVVFIFCVLAFMVADTLTQLNALALPILIADTNWYRTDRIITGWKTTFVFR